MAVGGAEEGGEDRGPAEGGGEQAADVGVEGYGWWWRSMGMGWTGSRRRVWLCVLGVDERVLCELAVERQNEMSVVGPGYQIRTVGRGPTHYGSFMLMNAINILLPSSYCP